LARQLLCSEWEITFTTSQETLMNTQISSKLAALAVALMMNSLIIGGVAYVFNAQTQHDASSLSRDRAPAQSIYEVA
jgi:hypothetical protein